MRRLSFPSMVVAVCVASLSLRGFAFERASTTAQQMVAAVWDKPGSSGGREVVVEPDVSKLKAHGLTLDQLATALGGTRFVTGQWTLEIEGKNIQLDRVARLTVREIQAPAFTVKLPDGRRVLITPDPKRIADYVVTGAYFEQDVRRALADAALADAALPDPSLVHVLQMIPVPGVLPHVTDIATGTHLSLGEPLKDLAKLDIQSNR